MTPHLLLESALRASLLGAGVWLLLRVLRNRSSTREWMIWLAVLAAALLMPIVSPYASGLFQDGVRQSSAPSIVDRIAGVSGELPSPVAAWRDVLRNTAALLWPIYLSVAGLLIGRLCLGLLLTRRMWHAAIPAPALSGAGMQVRATDRIDAPVVVASGILLPADWDTWSPQTLACVLMHERSHLARNDFHWQVLTQLHVALFWVSPFAWWLLRRISLLAEYLSDEDVVAAYGRPTDYAEVLLRFAGGRRTALPSVGMARRAALSQRIERLLSTQQRDVAQRQSSGFVLLGVAAVAATSVASPWLRIEPASADRSSVVSLGAIRGTPREHRTSTFSTSRLGRVLPAPESPAQRAFDTQRMRMQTPIAPLRSGLAQLPPLRGELERQTAVTSYADLRLPGKLPPLAPLHGGLESQTAVTSDAGLRLSGQPPPLPALDATADLRASAR